MESIATNRKARHEYHILQTIETGIVLTGTEVKSLRLGRANLKDSYARIEKGEVYLFGLHISPYEQGNRFNPDPLRTRKLLLHSHEIHRLSSKVEETGLTLIPLKMYFVKGKAKVELALAKGKKAYDKRKSIAEREARREIEREFKERQERHERHRE